ncbi:MAG: RrF2 family transcriptional regulator [Ktedonobacterales bacterium]
MRITMKGDYGLRAMIDLAAHYGEGPIPSAAIAARQRIPEHFLDQLLITLRRAGLLKSHRGPQGGHLLARAPERISMGDVIAALEGNTAPMECLPNPSACQLSPGCAIRDIWNQVEAYAQQLLRATTLQQLAERHRVPAQESASMYYI